MTTLIKKLSMLTLGLAMTTGICFSVSAKTSKTETTVNAATVETSRIWMVNSITASWDADGAKTYIHYWGGASSTTWPGVATIWDSSNGKSYYDVPSGTTGFVFARCSPAGEYWGAKTVDLVATGHFNAYYFDMNTFGWDPVLCNGTWNSFSPVVTTVVSSFADTLDTFAEACSIEAAQTAVDSYNALSTFEQDQFDALFVSEGVTGIQRLNYLKTFWNISTTLNVSNVDSVLDDKSVIGIVMVAVIGITAVGCFYFLTRKKVQA